MRCARADRYIDRFVDGTLSPSLAARLSEHLDGCARCRARAAEARRVADGFTRAVRIRAPEGFSSRVMIRVDGEEKRTEPGGARQAAPVYRRLGYSFMATAALLAASLLVPRLAYPNLIRPETVAVSLTTGQPAEVARILNDAGLGIRRAIGEQPQVLR